MALAYNRKTQQIERHSEKDFDSLVMTKNSDYAPIPSRNYKMFDPGKAQEVEVSGNDYIAYRQRGYTLSASDRERRLESLAKEDTSAGGQFIKNLVDEAGLGIYEEAEMGVASPIQKEILQKQREVYSTSRTIGGVLGWLPGLVAIWWLVLF